MVLIPVSGLILIMIVRGLRRDQARALEDAWTLIAFALYIVVAVEALGMIGMWNRRTCDPALLAADADLRINTLALVDWTHAHGWLWTTLGYAYLALPSAVGTVWVLEQNKVFRRAFVIGGLLCLPLYAAFPAVGPAHYNWALMVAPAGAARNCMPSMHLSWVLLMALNARSRWLRPATWSYAALMAAATVGLGQHYVVDLIAAVPFTALVQAVARVEWNTKASSDIVGAV
jgi:hypothetical protein